MWNELNWQPLTRSFTFLFHIYSVHISTQRVCECVWTRYARALPTNRVWSHENKHAHKIQILYSNWLAGWSVGREQYTRAHILSQAEHM